MRRWPAAIGTALAVTLLLYGPALRGWFAADDFLWVIHRAAADARQAVLGSWGLGVAWRPWTRLDFWLDSRLFGWTAWPWHAVNLCLHALNGALLWRLGRTLGLRPSAAVLSAGLFLAFPLNWENVDWISGRTGLWCLCLLLFCALALSRGRMVLACVLQAASIMAYEPAAMFPMAAAAVLAASGRPLRRPVIALGLTVLAVWTIRWTLLGRLLLHTDVASDAFMRQFCRNLLGIAAHLWREGGPAASLLPALLFAGLWRRQTRLLAAGLLSAALILYLPFSPVAGFTDRFAYLAAAPLALAAGLAADAPAVRGAMAIMVLVFALHARAQAARFAQAADTARAMAAGIVAAPGAPARIVFDGVPTHEGPFYLFWANFEDAAAALRHIPFGLAATSEWVLLTRERRDAALAGPTQFLRWDPWTRRFLPMGEQAWLHAHGIPVSPGLQPPG